MPNPSSRAAMLSLSSTDRLSPSLCVPSRSVVSNSRTSDPTISPPEKQTPPRLPSGVSHAGSGSRLAGGPLGNDDGGDRRRVVRGGLDRCRHDCGECTRAVSIVNPVRRRLLDPDRWRPTWVIALRSEEDRSMVEETDPERRRQKQRRTLAFRFTPLEALTPPPA